jgi:hypothetical protein
MSEEELVPVAYNACYGEFSLSDKASKYRKF